MATIDKIPLIWIVYPGETVKGGITESARTLASNIDPSRFELRLFSTSCDGFPIRKVFFTVCQWIKWISLIARGTDLVHIHTSWKTSFLRKSLFALPAYLRKIPVIFHVHPAVFIDFYEGRSPLSQKSIRFILKQATRIIVLTNIAADAFRRSLKLNRISTLPNAVDLRFFQGKQNRRKERTILYLGSIHPLKGTQDLIPLAARLAQVFSDFRIILCGNHRKHAFARKIKAAGIDHFFELRGWVDRKEKIRALERCSLMIIPSYSEGIPMTMLEGMAAGIPIVTTSVGGIPEVIKEDEEALFVCPGDIETMASSIIRIFHDKTLANRLSTSARQRVENDFSVQTIARRLENLYSDILHQKNERMNSNRKNLDRKL